MSYEDDARPQGRELTDDFEMMAERTERTGAHSAVLIRILYLVAFVLLLTGVGLAWQVQTMNRNIDDLEATVHGIEVHTQAINDYVIELQEPPSDGEREQSEAIIRAVRLVPDIRAILCEVFVDASACQR